ncbi:MAG: amidohydrolase [Desulfosporosinus sp.]|nr:amidohydrolase [Desulfosporosinus sp.]
MTKTLIKNAYIVTMGKELHVYQNGSVLIEDDLIKEIGYIDESQLSNLDEVIDAQGKIVMPGLINSHVHTSQHLGRGIGDDVPLLTWLHERTFPYESSLTEEDSYISSLLCILEQIRSGVTTFAEPGGQHVDGMAKAVTESGIRGILAKSTMDSGDGLPKVWQKTTNEELQSQVDSLEKWHGKADGRIRTWFGLRTIFNNSDELIVRTKELADRYNVGVHMHVAEVEEEIKYAKETRGATTVDHLYNLGVLDKNFLAVHCVWMSDSEIDKFAEKEVKVSHNPAAAMRVLGFAKIPEMIDKGILVSIGTDGAPSNNRMTLIDEMWLTSLIHKGRLLDPSIMPANQVLKMVTRDAARTILWDDEIGSLETDKKADLIIINPDSAAMLPLNDPIANLVTSMHSSNVESVMCNGKWVMKDRIIVTIDEQQIIIEAKKRAKEIMKRANIIIPDRFPVVK